MRWPYLVIVCAIASSCSTPHIFPVCYYNVVPPAGSTSSPYYDDLVTSLRRALGAKDDLPVARSPDGRWLLAEVTEYQNDKAANVWPRVGCIGDAQNSDEVKLELYCVRYVRDFVQKRNYFQFGNAKDAGGIDIWNESGSPGDVVHCPGGETNATNVN